MKNKDKQEYLYHEFVWKIGDKYISCYPEIDPTMIIVGFDKDQIKNELKERCTNLLKTLKNNNKQLPGRKKMQTLLEITSIISKEHLQEISLNLFII
jgi:hypothetical protein